jgi:DNA-directed RNA polymerase subunit RPC12/RpoP
MAGFCAKCGVPVESSTGFCPACGASAVAKKKTSTLKIVLIVLAVVFGLVVLAVGTIGFVGWRAMHSGAISVGQGTDVSEADLGVSIYPGAVANANGSVKVKMGNILTVTAMYTTSDPASSVLSFYQDKMGNMTTTQNDRATTLTSVTVDGNRKESIVVTVTPSAQDGGATKIMIAHTKTGTQ